MVRIQLDANGQYKITLPKQIVLAKNWKKGDRIRILITGDGDLVLKKVDADK